MRSVDKNILSFSEICLRKMVKTCGRRALARSSFKNSLKDFAKLVPKPATASASNHRRVVQCAGCKSERSRLLFSARLRNLVFNSWRDGVNSHVCFSFCVRRWRIHSCDSRAEGTSREIKLEKRVSTVLCQGVSISNGLANSCTKHLSQNVVRNNVFNSSA